ncbi:hypothetical protein [Prevotella sp. Rep29]|jgi:hypothetical protein|uniref:hypothetical protein n=1 Tax=Prevotella sp. Rep29 TaxID=2691580 RepID=UPI001C6DD48A|nr:hypothetical protein [Prevotella sp. Rep29]MBR1655231.1 hypothetical protein [Prevotella sp.]MBR3390536.1 hypothetical protein [Prevotella sp.]MBR7014510.1 hypothetical protein [Prevotella sp.]QYR10196.1 hypothetical protein GRF55_03305 [Prevotella sp. Rep29]
MKRNNIILGILGVLLVGAVAFLGVSLKRERDANEDMRELAALDKKEMENEYQQFADQYSEMKTRINNDSIIAQLTEEQLKTQRLLAELKKVKSDDAREITRLKKELATVREVLRSYVLEIDSLNRLNQKLQATNEELRVSNEEATRKIEGLSSERISLTEKVAIAAQLDATDINLTAKNKRGKTTKEISKAKTLQLNFRIAKNVTATTGLRTLYVRIMTPAGNILGGSGSFPYENKTLQYSIKRTVEYSGEEMPVTMYWDVAEALSSGTYQVSIFADGNMIGSRSVAFK